MKRISFLFSIVFILLAFQSSAQKIGHVNMETIIVDMPAYKVAMDSLQLEQKKIQVKLKKMESEYERAKKTYQDSAKLWSMPVRQIKQNDLTNIEANYKQFYQLSSMGLDSMQQLVLGRLVKKVKKAAQAVAKEKGITYVLNYSEQAQLVLYYEESHDLTALVRKKLGI